ncbi:hypothetical protein LPB140_02875 [Sphingorhabdus lutea]|uniref:Sigma-54 factor interaction domain-containing protein n=1 Tax=Sphingorhabdus lutea TaxID=1913578 RepID=A0A1L3JA49_9SPHN|nr:sigma-54 dependent transcriptional regulator [Sphingorhabdus lutea]APG61943.1 hypothetical protein LPB140_02875 [Sphingorhabdus lutea]
MVNVNNYDMEQEYISSIIGNSLPAKRLRHIIEQVAQSDAPILINGPSGTGKELVAAEIHKRSSRHHAELVKINCGAIPSELMESELFGHRKGSFTGAIDNQIGRFKQADKGSLFLDEIGEMSPALQVKLLRVLEDGRIRPIGAASEIETDARIISATNIDIDCAIEKGGLRADLFYRLGVVVIDVPTLKERAQDIGLLVEHFQKKHPKSRRFTLSIEAEKLLKSYDWPGNIRELRNFVERAQIFHSGEILDEFSASELIVQKPRKKPDNQPNQSAPTFKPFVQEEFNNIDMDEDAGEPVNLRELVEELEQQRIQQALNNCEGVIAEAARMLSLKRTTLVEKMRRYDLQIA